MQTLIGNSLFSLAILGGSLGVMAVMSDMQDQIHKQKEIISTLEHNNGVLLDSLSSLGKHCPDLAKSYGSIRAPSNVDYVGRSQNRGAPNL